jgi:hypothetical protein
MFSFNLCVVSDAFADEDADLANKIAKMISLSSAYTGAEPTQEERESFLRECEEYENAYKNARENEQSLANRTLTAVTTAATGIGGMELARGLAEQAADKNADASMDAYIATFRCTYGNGKQVKAGPEEIELPGGNDQNMMNLRAQYFALANDLKERKAALGMEPGIESEVILDKSQMGLYDDENIGITGGAYESLYRAKMLNSETDQTKIDEMAEASKKRVMGGAIAAGAGAVVGVLGDSLINGKLGEMIKENKNKNSISRASRAVTDKLKNCFKTAKATNVNKLDFSGLDLSSMSSIVDKIDCSSMSDIENKDINDVLDTSSVNGFASSFGSILGDKNAKLFEEDGE